MRAFNGDRAKVLDKVKRVIGSCLTLDQLEVANNMITMYDKMYKNSFALKSMDTLYSLKCNVIRKGYASKTK